MGNMLKFCDIYFANSEKKENRLCMWYKKENAREAGGFHLKVKIFLKITLSPFLDFREKWLTG